MTVENIDYALLVSDAALTSAFVSAVKDTIVDASPDGITEEDVDIELMAGSVIVVATITSPDVAVVESAQSTFEKSSGQDGGEDTMEEMLITSISSLPQISEVASGPVKVKVKSVSPVAMVAAAAPTPVPTPEPTPTPARRLKPDRTPEPTLEPTLPLMASHAFTPVGSQAARVGLCAMLSLVVCFVLEPPSS
jgi:hypothetical protein